VFGWGTPLLAFRLTATGTEVLVGSLTVRAQGTLDVARHGGPLRLMVLDGNSRPSLAASTQNLASQTTFHPFSLIVTNGFPVDMVVAAGFSPGDPSAVGKTLSLSIAGADVVASDFGATRTALRAGIAPSPPALVTAHGAAAGPVLMMNTAVGVPFTEIALSSSPLSTPGTLAGEFVITDAQAYAAFFLGNPPATPTVDFNTEVVLARASDADLATLVVSVERDASGRAVILHGRDQFSGLAAPAVYNPRHAWHVVKVAKSAAPGFVFRRV
jgi:hypothetical protein